jgi:hypothetical protein
MDGSKDQPKMTGGLDLGDKYSYLCLIDQQGDEVVEEGRLRTSPEAFRRRCASEQPPMRITHRGWHPLSVGEQGIGGMWQRGLGGQRS